MALRPEDRLQVHCSKYLKAALPEPGFYSGIEHARKQTLYSGMVQRAKGVKRGLADLNVWYLGQYIGIELKVSSSTSEPQKAFGAAMEANGFSWHVIKSVVALHDLLLERGVPVLPSMRVLAMQHDAALTVAPPKPKAATRPPRQRNPTAADIKRANAWYAMEDNFK